MCTPGYHAAVFADYSKCRPIRMQLLHVPELLPDIRAVTPTMTVAPAHDDTILSESSKGTISGVDLLHVIKLILDRGAVTTKRLVTQLTTVPSFRSAAKALSVA